MAGVALLPSTPVLLLEDMLPMLDMVVIMTVNPDFDGQKFIPEMVPKIARMYPSVPFSPIFRIVTKYPDSMQAISSYP